MYTTLSCTLFFIFKNYSNFVNNVVKLKQRKKILITFKRFSEKSICKSSKVRIQVFTCTYLSAILQVREFMVFRFLKHSNRYSVNQVILDHACYFYFHFQLNTSYPSIAIQQ